MGVGHDKNGNPNQVEIDVSTQTIHSVLRQKTKHVTNIELEPVASMAFLPDDATGLVSPLLSPAVAEKAPSSKNRPPCAYSPLYSEMSTMSPTSEINPAAATICVVPQLRVCCENLLVYHLASRSSRHFFMMQTLGLDDAGPCT